MELDTDVDVLDESRNLKAASAAFFLSVVRAFVTFVSGIKKSASLPT